MLILKLLDLSRFSKSYFYSMLRDSSMIVGDLCNLQWVTWRRFRQRSRSVSLDYCWCASKVKLMNWSLYHIVNEYWTCTVFKKHCAVFFISAISLVSVNRF